MKLICYLSNGNPLEKNTIEMAKAYAESGCDIIEVDLPARDPYLEGEFIASLMAKALASCDDYDKYLEEMEQIKKDNPDASLIIMIYEATVLEIGYEKFVAFCKKNGYLDLIFVGLKDEVTKERLLADGIRVSCYVQYDMQPAEIASAKESNGFVYLQAKPTTGNVNPKYPELKDCIRCLREEHGITRPIYCGVGIHSPEDAKMAKEAGADAVFVGSTILKLYPDKDAVKEKIKEFKDQCI
ncbi:MAG: tryptophan synthase subunit alpha [Parasporobacterium sp.]|nr:tryptophan synthase subunit alpha [Parasporobacterium sp.]